ncbi:MAG: ATP-dependent Clp protease ATP-binding subunit [Clostridiaceae bacterium]|nr:ATP-dependent Clp protease ATP-binding subunit [Clostridiaceae bacterium]
MKLCSRCNKNVAVIFVSKMQNGKMINEGLCLTCAKDIGLTSIEQLTEQFGIAPEMLENLENQVSSFFASSFDDYKDDDIKNDLGDETIGDFLNNIFSTNSHKEKSHKPKTQVNDKKPLKKKRILESYGINLTAKAKEGTLDRVIGRQKEIERVIQILNRRTKNNPVLIGEPGVGKTAIAEGLAMKIVEKEVPAKLLNKEVYLLDFTSIVAGTQFRGQFEARLKSIVDEAKRLGNIIMVIDELHNIVGAGEAEGAMSAANILKPALARGEIQVIGATTLNEYRKYIEKDSALERRFQTVIVNEPSIEETIEIIKGIKDYYEDYHKVKITDDIIKSAVILSERYITDRFLPDKAIDVLDEAASKANLSNKDLVILSRLEEKLRIIQEEKDNAINEDSIEEYQKAADLKMKECHLLNEIEEAKKRMRDVYLTVDDIASVIEAWTGIPVQKITELETEKLLKLEDILHKRIIGQEKAVSAVARAIRRTRAGLSKRRRPASFIFVGPTGVGKTELVKALSEALFDSEEALIRLDMSEYMEKHSVSKIIGSPPGYVGYDDAGQLTEKIRRRPYSVILLDEIEKAHPDVLNILLQILDDGRITDSHGKVINFENTIIIMTSNAGSDWKASSLGFVSQEKDALKNKLDDALKQIFRPEFLNRVDEIVVFDKLSKEEILKICGKQISELKEMLQEKNISFEVSNEVIEYLADKGFSEIYGARPLRRLISKELEDKIAEIVIANAQISKIIAYMKDGEIEFISK